MNDRFVVTGAHGCLGAWVVAELVREGTDVVALDIGPGRGRAELLLDEAELARVRFVQADITDASLRPRSQAQRTSSTWRRCSTRTAATTTPPERGSTSSARSTSSTPRSTAGAKLVYASSIAALADGSLYGTWKRANEGTAAAYWAEDRFPSIGVRPALVYGVGRDRGVTASMTLAMEAAARGEPFHIVHGGSRR